MTSFDRSPESEQAILDGLSPQVRAALEKKARKNERWGLWRERRARWRKALGFKPAKDYDPDVSARRWFKVGVVCFFLLMVYAWFNGMFNIFLPWPQ